MLPLLACAYPEVRAAARRGGAGGLGKRRRAGRLSGMLTTTKQ
jgi:hypothetical protein